MTIAVNCVIKNEDQWIGFALQSVLPYVDKVYICDTGSEDSSLNIIQSLESDKIHLESKKVSSPADITNIRQEMLDKVKENWILFLDGDEIWPEPAIKASLESIKSNQELDFLISRYKNLIGDVYHYQEERAGKYRIQDKSGHVTIRWINKSKLKNLKFSLDYPLEQLQYKNVALQDLANSVYKMVENPYLHATHLKRSSKSTNTFNREKKYKYELGEKFLSTFKYPGCFYSPTIDNSHIWKKRSLQYLFHASWQTPLKKLKRIYESS